MARRKKTEPEIKASANPEASAAKEETGVSVAEETEAVEEKADLEKEKKPAKRPRSKKASEEKAEEAKPETVDEAAKEEPAQAEGADATQEEAGKKDTAAKKPAKRASKKADPKAAVEKVEEVFVQYGELDVNTKDILDKVKQAYVAERHRLSSIKAIRLYIKPEERKAYYVINDKHAGEISLVDL